MLFSHYSIYCLLLPSADALYIRTLVDCDCAEVTLHLSFNVFSIVVFALCDSFVLAYISRACTYNNSYRRRCRVCLVTKLLNKIIQLLPRYVNINF